MQRRNQNIKQHVFAVCALGHRVDISITFQSVIPCDHHNTCEAYICMLVKHILFK